MYVSCQSVAHRICDSLGRFYTALYEKILDPELAVTKDQNDFVQLIYNAVRKDENVHRVRAFIKRLLQVSSKIRKSTF